MVRRSGHVCVQEYVASARVRERERRKKARLTRTICAAAVDEFLNFVLTMLRNANRPALVGITDVAGILPLLKLRLARRQAASAFGIIWIHGPTGAWRERQW